MKALRYETCGEPGAVVAHADIEQPQPKAGEVRIRVVRSPIHNHDLATIRGIYGVRPKLPATAGSEMAGVVEALGEGVAQLKVGQRVAGMVPNAWAEYATARAAELVPVPDSIEDDAAAQLLAMPLSAIVLFNELRVEPGAWIVQNAASGAVGRLLCAIAQSAGVNVVNLVRRESAIGELEAFGAKHVVVTGEGWPERVREITAGAPIARVVDSVCDAQSTLLNRLLGPLGEHVVFGALGATALKLDPGALIFGETVVRGFWMYSWMQRASVEARAGATMELFTLANAGALPLPVAGVYPLADAVAAFDAAESPGRPGKVLFAP